MNLRAKPIQGYITDSAGNTVRGAEVVIKEFTASSQYRVVDTVKTDSKGFFQSRRALKPGVYDIFESGTVMNRILHSFGNGLVPGFKPSTRSLSPSKALSLYGLAEDGEPTSADINEYILGVQIESDDIDVRNLGHTFPVYQGSAPNTVIDNHQRYLMTASSTITSSRFNIEYYYPNVQAVTYRYATWRGVHAVSYGPDKPLILPLTYDELFVDTSLPLAYATADDAEFLQTGHDTTTATFSTGNFPSQVKDLIHNQIAYGVIGKGDIVSVYNTVNNVRYWGIICNDLLITGGACTIWLRNWAKLQDSSFDNVVTAQVSFYHGFSQTMENASDTMSDRITVFEDMSAVGLV